MTATNLNINPQEEAISAFQSLEYDEKLIVLASLYSRIREAIPANATDALPKQEAENLITRLQQLSHEDQLSALRVFLPADKTDPNAVALDPHPTKALAELVTGGGKSIPTQEYTSLNAESKLAFWYLIAQRLGNNFVGIPSGTQASASGSQVLTLLESLKPEELVSFLKRVL